MAQLQSAIPPSPFKSILNFRDVAQTINNLNPNSNLQLNPDLFYRSARPDGASPEDRQAVIQKYHIKTVLDLRSKSEHLEAAEKFNARQKVSEAVEKVENDLAAADDSILPPPPPATTLKIPEINYEEIDLHGGAFIRAMFWKLSWLSMGRLLWFMALGYRTEAIQIWAREIMAPRGMIGLFKDCLDFSRVEIGACFKVLAEADNYPILVHCTQGKDRTGLIVLMVLLLLQVPREAIEADYMVSERELVSEKRLRIEEFKKIGLGEEFAACPPGFVKAIKDHLDERWGGIEAYLDGCGVDGQMRALIRSILLKNQEQ